MPQSTQPNNVPTRGPLNLAELIESGMIEVTDVRIADADAVVEVELELLQQLDAVDSADAVAAAEARERVLGYPVESDTGDLHDFVERRLVTEYLIATGIDALPTPIGRKAPLYSHVARDGTLVAISGDIAPEAIVQRLTSCPRVLLYGLDASGLELQGRLFRRTAPVRTQGWPDRARRVREGPSVESPTDLLSLLEALESASRSRRPLAAEPAARPRRPQAERPERRRTRHIPLTGDE